MTQDKDALTTLLEQLRHGDGAELIHRLVAGGLQALVNCEAEARIGAGHYERSEDRTAWLGRQPGQAGVHRRRRCDRGHPESCAPAAFSPRCSPPGGASTSRCTR